MNIGSILKLSLVLSFQNLALLALIGQLRLPDDPFFYTVQTDLWDPWRSWCTWQGDVVTGCYGTSYAHIGGPYSILWYWIMIGISGWGHFTFTFPLWILNLAVTGIVWNRRILVPYTITSFFFLTAYPQNELVLFALIIPFLSARKLNLFLAPSLKLPIMAPVQVWMFFLSNPTSIHEPDNWPVYGVLAVWWISSLLFQLGTGSGKVGPEVAPNIRNQKELATHNHPDHYKRTDDRDW